MASEMQEQNGENILGRCSFEIACWHIVVFSYQSLSANNPFDRVGSLIRMSNRPKRDGAIMQDTDFFDSERAFIHDAIEEPTFVNGDPSYVTDIDGSLGPIKETSLIIDTYHIW